MRFAKFHGYGNDYVVLEATEARCAASPDDAESFGELVRRVCHRHYGAGADGVALIEKSEDETADYHLRIFNVDGGEAAMSGNGSRCAAAYLHYEGLWTADELRFATRAGVKRFRFRGREGNAFRFEAEIGRPQFASDAIPMLVDEKLKRVIDYDLPLSENERVRITALQVCNPNACIIVDSFDAIDWRRIGATIERHAQFPERTNVEFIKRLDDKTIEARVWERGVGETLASGTGACAAAIAACVNGLTGRRVTVKMPGGELQINWRESDGEVVLAGTAEAVYIGEFVAKR